jgi:hypothetical protein
MYVYVCVYICHVLHIYFNILNITVEISKTYSLNNIWIVGSRIWLCMHIYIKFWSMNWAIGECLLQVGLDSKLTIYIRPQHKISYQRFMLSVIPRYADRLLVRNKKMNGVKLSVGTGRHWYYSQQMLGREQQPTNN